MTFNGNHHERSKIIKKGIIERAKQFVFVDKYFKIILVLEKFEAFAFQIDFSYIRSSNLDKKDDNKAERIK